MSKFKNHVILIDDDHGPMDYYIQMLKTEGFDVEHIDETDTAFSRIQNWPQSDPPALFVVDMMMPHGTTFTALETDDGLHTGARLIKECRQRLPNTLTVCLTNFNGIEEVRELIGPIEHFAKYDISPSAFAQKIRSLVPKI